MEIVNMEKYINQIVAIDTILGNPPDAHYPSWFAEQIANLPAADVVEVVHGEWLGWGKGGMPLYENYGTCSVCHEDAEICTEHRNYCPNCGAKMKGNKE
jgi:hypothetical protein